MINENAPRERLFRYMDLVLRGELAVEVFCSSFEQVYNLELNKSDLCSAEAKAFSSIFDRVVWYSPYPKERREIPHYLGETDIIDAVRGATVELQGGPE